MPRSTQLTNVRHRNAAPTGFTHGDSYFDEVTKRLYVAWAGAWVPIGTTPEVNVSTAGPSPRVGEVLWVDTDDTPAATTTPWTTLPLLNGWGNFDVNGGPGQSGFQWAEYRRVGDQVWTRGLINNGVATIGTAIANLPAGFRPAHRQMQMTATATTQLAARLDVLTSGDIVCDAGVSAGWLNLVTSFSTL